MSAIRRFHRALAARLGIPGEILHSKIAEKALERIAILEDKFDLYENRYLVTDAQCEAVWVNGDSSACTEGAAKGQWVWMVSPHITKDPDTKHTGSENG